MYPTFFVDSFLYCKNWLLWCIAPPVCAYCKTFLVERTVLCAPCKQNITPLISAVIPVTKKHHMVVVTVGEYKDPLKKLILSKGWSDYVASHELGQLMYEYTPIKNMVFDYIVPIPLHWTRYTWRGYNQAHEMALALSRRLGIPCVELLKRERGTLPQSSVRYDKRAHNVKRAFVCAAQDNELFKGKSILLVDDLMTTGATLQSAAKTITQHLKIKDITAVVASRVK